MKLTHGNQLLLPERHAMNAPSFTTRLSGNAPVKVWLARISDRYFPTIFDLSNVRHAQEPSSSQHVFATAAIVRFVDVGFCQHAGTSRDKRDDRGHTYAPAVLFR